MVKTKRLFSFVSALVLTFSALAVWAPQKAAAATRVWDGEGSDNKFSTAANWVGDAAPQAGDIISFNTFIQANENLINDLGFALGGIITASGDPGSNFGEYIIDTVEVQNGASLLGEAVSTCDESWPRVRIQELESSGSVTMGDGVLFGETDPVVNVNGALTLKGINALRTGSGSSIGSVVLEPGAFAALECGGMGGGAAPGSNFSGFTMNSLTVRKGTSTFLGNVTFPLTLGGGSGTGAPSVSFFGNMDEDFNYLDTEYTISGTITLLGDAYVYVGSKTTVKVTGAINGTGYKITKLENSEGKFINNSSSNNSDTPSGSQDNKPKETKLEGDEPNSHPTIVDKETAILLGKRGSVTVLNGGTLKGTGTATYITAYGGSKVAPGLSPGTITVLNSLALSEGAEFEAELLNKDTYDKFVVGDASTGGVTLDNATLKGLIADGFKINAGDTFTIIDNRHTGQAVTGTFKDLPEGATFKISDGVFKITYVGGDGNDVVLSVVTVPKTPSSGFMLIFSNPYAILAATIAVAGAAFYLSRRFVTAKAK